ncbi:SAM complex protein [Microdochium nivale]|nr:SAM complex protein [Microdochium nivale]
MPDASARQSGTPQQQPQTQPAPPSTTRSRPAVTSPTSTTSPSSGWFSIPAPLARLFKQFPLLTYPPNELPARSPQQRDVATLYVFISNADALRGLPSYNPTCLKWQTFLRLAGVENLRITSSNNHASPNGALPFLIAPSGSSGGSLSSTATSSPLIIPSNKLEQYALSHARANNNKGDTNKRHPTISDIPSSSSSQSHRFEAYTALLDHKIRNAWLHALYLCPRNTELLRYWYIRPASSSAAVQAATLLQLRAAAEAEITRSSTHNTLRVIYRGVGGSESEHGRGGDELYDGAREAFSALATCLHGEDGGGAGDEWFFGADAPGVFDAAVFAYTHLILLDNDAYPADGGDSEKTTAVDGGGGGDAGDNPGWGDRTLAEIVCEFPSLVRHHDRVYRRCWGVSS